MLHREAFASRLAARRLCGKTLRRVRPSQETARSAEASRTFFTKGFTTGPAGHPAGESATCTRGAGGPSHHDPPLRGCRSSLSAKRSAPGVTGARRNGSTVASAARPRPAALEERAGVSRLAPYAEHRGCSRRDAGGGPQACGALADSSRAGRCGIEARRRALARSCARAVRSRRGQPDRVSPCADRACAASRGRIDAAADGGRDRGRRRGPAATDARLGTGARWPFAGRRPLSVESWR
jgi:hypothetical protein